jgi:ABC-2 type transport system ATP-binding protein
VAIIAGGKVPYAGVGRGARDRIPAQVRLETGAPTAHGAPRCPPTPAARPVLEVPAARERHRAAAAALIEGEAGILSLSIERAGLHDAFVAIAGEAATGAISSTEPSRARSDSCLLPPALRRGTRNRSR